MLERANGQFTIEGQVEDIFGGTSGVTRIARISQTCHFTGALEGDSIAELTAVLLPNGEQRIQGFQRISGKLGERAGSFVVQVSGNAAKGQPRGEWTIVPKTGTGDFVHIRGTGTFSQPTGKLGSYAFEFDLRKPRKTGVPIAETEPVPDDPAPVAASKSSVPPKRPRRKPVATPPAIESVESAQPAPRRTGRKNASAVPVPETIPAQPTPDSNPPKSTRSRKASPAPQPPQQLPVASDQPVRTRRTKAA